MKIVKREMSSSELILKSIEDSKQWPAERIDYIELTSLEADKLYDDVASGVVQVDGCWLTGLRDRRSILGVPLRIVDGVELKRIRKQKEQ